MSRFFKALSIRAKLRLSLWTFAFAIVVLAAIGVFAANVLSTVRAYVGGEGLWSKGQKDAIYNLVQYSYSADERDFQAYRALLAVPLADRRARLELEKPDADLSIADQAFIEGRNDPEEVRNMSLLFRRFRNVSYISRAIAYWAEGDRLIAELEVHADALHDHIREGTLTAERRSELLGHIDNVNHRLTIAEDRFSYTLGEAARWLRGVILWSIVIGAALCLGFGLTLSSLTSRQIVQGIRNLHEGTARVSAADFEGRISVVDDDELGQLATDFNRMTDSLVRAHKERAAAEIALEQRAIELERSNQQLVEAQAIGKIGSWEWDIEKNLITWSDELYRIYGQTREAFVGKYQNFLEHVHPDDRERVGLVVAEAREKKQSFQFEHRTVQPSGAIRWVLGQGRAITNSRGELVRMAGTSLDITERIQAEEARVRFLAEQSARKTAEADSARAALLAEASVLLASSLDYAETLATIGRLAVPRFADVCVVRMSPDESGAPAPDAIVHVEPERLAAVRELREKYPKNSLTEQGLSEVMKTGKATCVPSIDDATYKRIAQDPTHLNLLREVGVRSILVVPMTAHGQVLGAMAFGLRGTARRYTDVDLSTGEELGRRAGIAIDNARLYKIAKAAIAARDEFLSIASHELRTPLTPLQLQLDSLQLGMGAQPSDAKVAKKIETAARQVRRLTRLVDGLLDVSRLSAGRLHLEREQTDLTATTRDVCDRFGAEARLQKCEVRVHASGPVTGLWDAVRIDQIIVNLLSNALKYGAGKPIDLTVQETHESGILVVRDNGIGIAPEQMQRIFDRYERAVSPTAYGGLGLGLFITKQLVEAHGGRVWATKNEDVGVSFTVELPKAPPTATADPNES